MTILEHKPMAAENTDIFAHLESEVRSYSRNWPAVFDKASGSWIRSEDGKDFSGDAYGRIGAQLKLNQNWGVSGDVKFASGDTQVFIGPRFSW